jgi:formylmethanofuran dehydrogenase subunit E
MSAEGDSELQRAVAFHGHLCPGLVVGYRAARLALRELGVARAHDEELIAISETDFCGVDAIQVVTGCTLGKGNLIVRDWGKQVFTFGRRSDGRMLRVARRFGVPGHEGEEGLSDEQRKGRTLERLEALSDGDLFDVRWVDAQLPEPARVFRSVRCAQCGEGVMEPRVRLRDGYPLCPACYGEEYHRRC